jgi:hypothetical protein
MSANILLPLSLILSIQAQSQIATTQILQQMYHILGFDVSKKLLLKLLPLLSPQQRDYLRSISP